jgi:hypothetical protein
MPYPTILPLTSLDTHIQETLLRINNGVYAWNQQSGTAVWMPTEVKFDAIVIDQFQALAVVTVEGGSTTTLQSGTDTQVTSGTTSDNSNQTTQHGETSSTIDDDSSFYVQYDQSSSAGGPLQGPSFPF